MFLPKTVLGKVSIAFASGFFLALGTLMFFGAMGETGGDALSDNYKLAVPGVTAAICGLMILPAGLWSVIKQRERAVLVFMALGIGLLVSFFVIGELVVPH